MLLARCESRLLRLKTKTGDRHANIRTDTDNRRLTEARALDEGRANRGWTTE